MPIGYAPSKYPSNLGIPQRICFKGIPSLRSLPGVSCLSFLSFLCAVRERVRS